MVKGPTTRNTSCTLLVIFIGVVAMAGFTGVARTADTRPTSARPVELGRIDWLRDLDNAQAEARKSGKPILILFQEVPGCATCVNYGQQVLSHPIVADAAENLFVPVAIYNNLKGDDADVLTAFEEPSWNNPVVRIVDADRKPLADRVANDYSIKGLVAAMTSALAKSERDIPVWLQLLAAEQASLGQPKERATLAMHCFWEGEAGLGTLPGVLSTQPGFLGGVEVVEVEYNPRELSFASLLDKADARQCASKVFARSAAQRQSAESKGITATETDDPIRPDKEPKYYLANHSLRFVPMTELQQMRVNAALGTREDPLVFLAPRQQALARLVQKNPDAGWVSTIGTDDFLGLWERMEEVAKSPVD